MGQFFLMNRTTTTTSVTSERLGPRPPGGRRGSTYPSYAGESTQTSTLYTTTLGRSTIDYTTSSGPTHSRTDPDRPSMFSESLKPQRRTARGHHRHGRHPTNHHEVRSLRGGEARDSPTDTTAEEKEGYLSRTGHADGLKRGGQVSMRRHVPVASMKYVKPLIVPRPLVRTYTKKYFRCC